MGHFLDIMLVDLCDPVADTVFMYLRSTLEIL